MGLRTTYTYVETDIVVHGVRGSHPRVYFSDYSYDSDTTPRYVEECFPNQSHGHIRQFDTMAEFSQWCLEYGCVVRNCTVINT